MNVHNDPAKTIFLRALEIASEQDRLAFVEEQCGRNEGLRAEVEGLLRHHQEVGSFLQTPALEPARTESLGPSSTPQLAKEDASERTEVEPVSAGEDLSLGFLSPSDNPEHLGRLGPYEITEVVGRGGMGIVLKARDAKLDRVVAIKVLAPELAGNATARRRFLREAQAAAAVTHQHVVALHAVDDDRLPYLVMEYVDGMSLEQKIATEGPLELKEILRIGMQIAAGLEAAHTQGLIHRDIKPANVLLENGIERVRITDFGLARAVDDVAITREGEITGTPQYMSPEQAQNAQVDARSDLFSLGCVLYAMCTGRSPFRAETSIAAIRRVCDDQPRPIRKINPEIPQWLVEIVDRLLEKRSEDRFQTAHVVTDLLGRHLAHLQDPGSTPQPGSLKKLPRHRAQPGRRRLVLAVGLLLAVAGFSLTEFTGITKLVGLRDGVVPSDRATGDDAAFSESSRSEGPLVGPRGEIDLLRLIDPERDSRGGQWRFDNDTLVSPGTGRWDRLVIPYDPPEEYDLEITARRRSGTDMLSITLVSGKRQFFVGLDMFEGTLCGLGLIDGKDAFTNETTTERAVFADGLPHKIFCRVRRDGVSVTVDGDPLIDWRGALDRLSVPEEGRTGRLGLTAMHSVYHFYDVILRSAGEAEGTVAPSSPATTLSMPEVARYPTTHSGPVLSIAASPGGRVIATGSSDNTIQLFDRNTRAVLHELPGDTAYDLKFTSDGRQLLSAGDDGTVRLWDIETGEEIRRFTGHHSWVASVDLSVDGRTVLTSSHDGTIRIWDFESTNQLHEINVSIGKANQAFSVRFDADGDRFVSAHVDGTVTIWDASTRKKISRIPAHQGMAYNASFSPDVRSLLTTGSDGVACLWDIDSRRRLQTFPHAENTVSEGEFLAGGRFVVTSSGQKTLRVWSVDTGREIAAATGLTNCMSSLALLSDGHHLVTAGGLLRAHPENGKMIWEGDGDYDIRIWRLPEEIWAQTESSTLIDQQISELTDQINQSPEDGSLQIARAHLYVRQRRWREAAEDFRAAGDTLYKRPGDAFGYAILLVYLGENDLHRRLCEQMLKRFAETDDVWTANCLVKSCLLRPGVVDSTKLPTDLLSEDREFVTDEPPWVLREARALIAYRSGEFEECRRQVRETMALPAYKDDPLYAPRALAILAMANYRSGDVQLARELYDQAVQKFEELQLPPGHPGTIGWLYAEILRREAAKVIGVENSGAAITGEPRAFVVLGKKGSQRKFATLPEAAQGSSDGDTIEIRGNGPFVSDPIVINHALTIRAADGFRPIIRLRAQDEEAEEALLITQAPLVLEGLELQRTGQPAKHGKPPYRKTLFSFSSAPLYVANCRFVAKYVQNCIETYTDKPVVVIRNCDLISDRNTVGWHYAPRGRLTIDNCVHVGRIALFSHDQDLTGASIVVRSNSFLGRQGVVLQLLAKPRALEGTPQANPIRLEAIGNLFDPYVAVLQFDRSQELKDRLGPIKAEALLPRLLVWQDQRNLYTERRSMIGMLCVSHRMESIQATSAKDLADWKQLWGAADDDVLNGHVRYQRGDFLAKAQSNPEQLTPEDFRLHSDSAGYRAGPDGKDLGADIDLVGPGEAYERWKKTPEYQEWLEETQALMVESAELSAALQFFDQQLQQSQWPEAAETFRALLKQQGLSVIGQHRRVAEKVAAYAVVLVHLGELDQHRQFCTEFLNACGATEDFSIATSICKACLVVPGVVDVSLLPVKPIDAYLETAHQEEHLSKLTPAALHAHLWKVGVRALISYRSGQYQNATRWAAEFVKLFSMKGLQNPSLRTRLLPRGLAIMAMAHHRSRQFEQAQKAFEEAKELFPPASDSDTTVSGLYTDMLLREAADVLGVPRDDRQESARAGRPDPVVAPKPTTNN